MDISVLTASQLSFVLWTSLILLAVMVTLNVRAVRSRRESAGEKHYESVEVCESTAQIDDPRTRDAATEDDLDERKNHIMGDL